MAAGIARVESPNAPIMAQDEWSHEHISYGVGSISEYAEQLESAFTHRHGDREFYNRAFQYIFRCKQGGGGGGKGRKHPTFFHNQAHTACRAVLGAVGCSVQFHPFAPKFEKFILPTV